MLSLGKRVTRQEAVAYFDEMQELGLVGQTDNCLTDNSIICICCDCCCSQLRGGTRWGNMSAILSSHSVPVAGDDCIQYELCMERCPLGALAMDDETERRKVATDECVGCGVCTLTCPEGILKLVRHERATPFNTGK